MQRALRNQRIVILLPETSRAMQRPCNNTNSLELCPGVRDGFLVDGERLCEELIGYFFEASLVSDLSAGDEETETEVRSTVAGVEGGDGGVHEFEEGGGLRGPVVVVVFAGLVLSGKFQRGSYESRRSVFYAFVTVGKGFAGGLEERELCVVIGGLNQVYYPGEPALFYHCLLGLGAPTLVRHTGVAAWLLHAFSDEDSENLQDSF